MGMVEWLEVKALSSSPSAAKEIVTRLKRQSTECEKIIQQGTNIQNPQGTQKTQPPKNQHFNEEMGT
jgi:hypothetical protein